MSLAFFTECKEGNKSPFCIYFQFCISPILKIMTFFLSNSALDSMKQRISHGIELISKTFVLKGLHHKELRFVSLIVFLAFLDPFSPLFASPPLFFAPDTNHVSCSDPSCSPVHPGPQINITKAVQPQRPISLVKCRKEKGSDYIGLRQPFYKSRCRSLFPIQFSPL